MSEQDLTLSMREMMVEMTAMRAELNSLKAHNLTHTGHPPTSEPTCPKVNSTRRKTLKRLGLALLGGAAAATVASFAPAQAKIIASSGVSQVGAIVLAPEVPNPTGNPISSVNIGLVVIADPDTIFNLANSTDGTTGIYSQGGIYGIYGKGTSIGVIGEGTQYGLFGKITDHADVPGTYGVYGFNEKPNVVNSFGVYGISQSVGEGSSGVYGYGVKIGVRGEGQAGGVFAASTGDPGNLPATTLVGVIGNAGTNLDLSTVPENSVIGVYGAATVGDSGYAGYFKGNVNITGSISKGSGTFKIDHPLDPANKYLYHSFVESPDMKNIYDGVVTLDERGVATVEMPDWFEALNSDFRYQLTSIGTSMPDLFIAEKLTGRQFKIAGGKNGQEVSWMVTGIRQDAFARAYRSPVEEDKTADDKGTYLHPELFGQAGDQSQEMAVYPRPKIPAGTSK